MLTIVIAILFWLSIYLMVSACYGTITILVQVLGHIFLKKGKITFNFIGVIFRFSFGAYFFIVAVILTLIRYGVFKV